MATIQATPKVWAELRIEWSFPDDPCHCQPPNGQPHILFAACVTSWGPEDMAAVLPPDHPKRYSVYLRMCTPRHAMKPETLLKQRTTRTTNLIKKRSDGMPAFIKEFVKTKIMSKRPTDYLTIDTCKKQYDDKRQVLQGILDDHDRRLTDNLIRLDSFPEIQHQMRAKK